ncbi:MAG TPA: hypothetical protein VFW87_15125 [Pirellulales bacterium]|nr:hypothetical protein [Pirellulales bacterium]
MSEPCVEPASTPETAASADDLPGLPRPFQYRLRTMFAAVAILSMLFAVMDAVGMVWSVVLVWFLLLAVAHVTANAWGSKTSERAVAARTDDTQQTPPSLESPRVVPWGDVPWGDAARLRQTTRLGWPMIVLTVAGALAGGALASTALMLLSHPRVGYAGVVVGTLSAATVSGFLAFLTSSFVEVAGRAWQEAAHGAVPPERGSP